MIYSINFLNKDLLVYYRNFKSWLGKFGFYGEMITQSENLDIVEKIKSLKKLSLLFIFVLH